MSSLPCGRISAKCATRPGSALLVVLGMLAFMVISGVAFSVYMRSTRLTSSFTRRASSTRQLAKAALAEAIDQIDRSIGNDPHPNVRRNGGDKYNHWLGRVLLTPYEYVDDDGNTTMKWASDAKSDIINRIGKEGNTSLQLPKTVPVLTLESLAYIPPPLVNEARYYGQVTPTAQWQTFDFDAGRYAYIALDVSDYFDVNRLVADEPRSSNPSRRVSFSHLFEGGTEDDPHSSAPSGTDGWDSFMDTYRDVKTDGSFDYSSKIPFVSLADFNLAFDEKFTDSGLNGMKSPFCRYIKNGGGTGFYRTTAQNDLDKFAEMTFVTDSYEATEANNEDGIAIYLDDINNQMFSEGFFRLRQEDRNLLSIGTMTTRPFKRLVESGIPYVTMFTLSDYLDRDRVPISLAIPSVERVPMICGIKPSLGDVKVKVEVLQNADTGGNDKEVSGSMANKDKTVRVQRNVRWRLDASSLASGFMGGQLQTLVVYPFRNHERTSENSYFNLDGQVHVFLSSEVMRLRTGNANDLLHWSASGTSTSGGSAKLVGGAVMNLPLNAESIPLKSAVSDPENCVQQINFDLSSAATAIATELSGDKGDILNVTYEWERNLTSEDPVTYDNGYNSSLPPADKIIAASSALRPLRADGTVDSDFSDNMTKVVEKLDKTLQLNLTATLRVTSSSTAVIGNESSGTKTVDMVPATLHDDKPLNDIDNTVGLSADIYSEITGRPTPLMKFEMKQNASPSDAVVSFPVKLDLAAVCDSPVKPYPQAIMIDDPRYNHAPENWKELVVFSPSGWYAAQSSKSREGDIFMAVSDQGYMQSATEFAFLPRCSDLSGSSVAGDVGPYVDADGKFWERIAEYGQVDADLMWKTYDLFGQYRTGGDDFADLGCESSGNTLKVNPYSDSTNVIMAAFANTPHDWRAASEDEEANPGANQKLATFNGKYAWNSYSSGSKLAWEDLEAVAGEFMEEIQGLGNNSWETALYNLFNKERIKTRTGYEDTEDYLCGVKLESPSDKIYSVDKKFLYGYWRSCFSARQQLFLVFFRAEPMMLGGGVAGVTPPQLGARGVALVWRNPNNPKDSAAGTKGYNGDDGAPFEINTGYIPHQTRVLFYKQFE